MHLCHDFIVRPDSRARHLIIVWCMHCLFMPSQMVTSSSAALVVGFRCSVCWFADIAECTALYAESDGHSIVSCPGCEVPMLCLLVC